MGVQSSLDCFYNYIEKKQPSSRIEKYIYVKTSFNIPLTMNYLYI